MRLKDIDFRLWDKKKAKFIDLNQQSIVFFKGDLQREGKFALVSPDFVCSPVLNADDFDIELYSCIKDMCGNKLYENDIVAHMSGRVIEYHSVVKFNRNIGAFGLVGIEYPFSRYPNELDSRFKVVGNIHENPELLGGEE